MMNCYFTAARLSSSVVVGLLLLGGSLLVASTKGTDSVQYLGLVANTMSLFDGVSHESGAPARNGSALIESWLFDPDWFILEASLCAEEQFESYEEAEGSHSAAMESKGSLVFQLMPAEDDSLVSSRLYDPNWLLVEDIGNAEFS